MRPLKRFIFVFVLAAGATVACRGHLPPTEPPPSIADDPSTRTNDAPAAGPLAGPASPLPGDSSKGGSSVLPLPPPSSGSGGSLP